MNKKLVLLGILLLVGLTLSGCLLPPPPSGGHSYGYYGYSHGHDSYHHGYGYSPRDRGDYHRGSGHGPRHGR